MSDGSSRYASNGFFDPYDCPPWDIWLEYSDRTLISWVPEVVFPLAQVSIDANALDWHQVGRLRDQYVHVNLRMESPCGSTVMDNSRKTAQGAEE